MMKGLEVENVMVVLMIMFMTNTNYYVSGGQGGLEAREILIVR